MNVPVDSRGIANVSVSQVKVKILNDYIGANRQRRSVWNMVNNCFSVRNIERRHQWFHVSVEKGKGADDKAAIAATIYGKSAERATIMCTAQRAKAQFHRRRDGI